MFENENQDEVVETFENAIDLNKDDNTSFKNSEQKEFQESTITSNSKRSRKLPKKFTEFEMY